MKLSIRHNSIILNHKYAFIWRFYNLIHHFVLFFSILSEKGKFYIKRKSNTREIFFRLLFRVNIFKRLIIYQSGITINISNTESVKVLFNLQFKLIFSMLKKSCKNEYICWSNIYLSDIITCSRIGPIIFFIEDSFVS